jgi:hypothetical protein
VSFSSGHTLRPMLPADLADDAALALDLMQEPDLHSRWLYYSGQHPRVFLSTKMMEVFRTLADAMADNYCGLAVNARVSRLEILSWDTPAAQDLWDLSRLPQRQDRLYRWALAYGSATILLEGEPGDIAIRVNRPTQACAVEDPERPDVYRLAAKRWVDPDGHHLTLWYPDEVVRLTQPPGKIDPQRWELDPFDPGGVHGWGAVPAVSVRPYADGPVLIDTLKSSQDRINKITSNKMVAGEFSAFTQRVYFTRQEIDPYEVRQAPDHAIVLDPGDPGALSSVQQLPAADLTPYIADRTDEIDNLFTLASLPRHMRVNPGTPPSGAAIKADEGPFVEALRDNQREIGESLITLLAIAGVEAEPIWRPVEVNDDAQSTTSFAQVVASGVPWQVAAREYLDWDEETIAEAEALKQANRDAMTAAGAAALVQLNANPTMPTEGEQQQPSPPPPVTPEA